MNSKVRYLKMLEKTLPKFDSIIFELILKTPDPIEQIVGLLVPVK